MTGPGQILLLRVIPLLLLCFSLNVHATERGGFLGAKETHYPAWFKQSFLDLGEDVAEAAANGRRLLLFFHQDGCPYCNLLVERNLSQREIRTQLQERFDVVAVNMFGDRDVTALDGTALTEKQLAESLRVQFTPSLLFFEEAGEVVLRLNGYIPPERFKLALEYAAGEAEDGQSYRDFLAAKRPAEPRGALNPQPFFQSPPYLLNSREARPLAVFFEQTQCPECDRLHDQVLVDDDVRRLLLGYDVVQLDMWSQTPLITPQGRRTRARDWARELEIDYAPTFVLFDAGGREVIRSEALFKRFHTASILDYCLSGAYLQQPSFQRFLSARAEHIREQGRDVDIWQ
jgi:thioredoxin-related protein